MLVLFVNPGGVVRLFIQDPETVAYGEKFMRAFCLAIPFLIADFMAVGVFQAVGMGKAALILAISRKLVLELPLTYLLNGLFPLYGLPYAQTLAEVGVAVIAIAMLMRLFKRLADEKTAAEDAIRN